MHQIIGFILALSLSSVLLAESLTIEPLTDDLHHPWSLAFLPEGEFLVTERSGALKHLDANGQLLARIEGVPEVAARGQGGLLDVVLHPQFADNRWVYLTWSGQGSGGNATHLGRGRLIDDRLQNFEILFVATPFVNSSKHFGSRLVFDGKGHLFMTVGDRGERERAQAINDHNGSVLRLTEDGKIPTDNPFVGRQDALPAIFSFGHRNPQGAALHPQTRQLWMIEHGPRGGDEVNIPQPGANYGWPRATFGREYYGPKIGPTRVDGMQDSLYHWTPSIAPSGLAFYSHKRFPQWQGDLFVGALSLTHLVRLELEGERVVREHKYLDNKKWRIRDVRQGPDGFLYLLTDHRQGRLLRVAPAG